MADSGVELSVPFTIRDRFSVLNDGVVKRAPLRRLYGSRIRNNTVFGWGGAPQASGALLIDMLPDFGDHNGAFAHCRGHALDRPSPHVADSKNAGVRCRERRSR